MDRVPLKHVVALAAVLTFAAAARAADPAKPPARATTPVVGAPAKPGAPAAAKPATPPKTPPPAKGAPKPPGRDPKDAAAKAGAADKPARNKTRTNSVLESDKLLPGRVDLRSESERKRDAELRSHFSRVAELDAIAAVAADKGDVSLQEYVELVRRKELQRHQKVMIALSRADAQASALATAGGQP